MGKASAEQFSINGDQFLGKPYKSNDFDCQDFVEKVMKTVGITDNLAGSNAWYRKMTWVGTPEECVKKFGSIPNGALVYILKNDGGEPAKYRNDGIGNADHIGIVTHRTGRQMCEHGVSMVKGSANDYDRITSWQGKYGEYVHNYGDGAIHSSASRGRVVTSTFKDKTIKGGWNRIGLWDRFDYGFRINSILSGGTNSGKEVVTMAQMKVTATKGDFVNMRKIANKNADLVAKIPIGETVEVISNDGSWANITWNGKTGWMMSEFLVAIGEGEKISVNKADLEKAYDLLGDMLGLRG